MLMLLDPRPVPAADIYKRVDASGRTFFTDKPAEGQKYALPSTSRSTPAPDQAARQADTQRLLDVFAEERHERQLQLAEKKKQDEEREQQCKKARNQLAEYESAGYLYDQEPNGEQRILNDTEHAEALAKARAEIEHWCG
jgi:hypothetical protein